MTGYPRRAGQLILALATLSLAVPTAFAQSTTCADEFRSGKLYFAQALHQKAVERFAAAVAGCPDKGEYHARYAMALSQRGEELLAEAFTSVDTKEARDVLVADAVKLFVLAGSEFDTAAVVEDKKSLLKFVRENREHYWVEHYNRALQFVKDEKKVPIAAVEFEIARALNPANPKAYGQGAVALIRMGKQQEATEVVKQGLAIAPEDSTLVGLLDTIYKKSAEDYAQQAQENKDPQAAAAGEDLVIELLKRSPEDANLYFLRGVLRATKGSLLMPESGEGVSPEAAGFFHGAAEDFEKAAELVPPEKDKTFHMDALFNQTQANLNAGNCDEASEAAKKYLALNHAEPNIWKFLSVCLIEKDSKEMGVAALMVSKSLDDQGGVIADTPEAVQTVVQSAVDDAAAAVAKMGPPDAIYGYQEQSSGNQIQTWFWPAKHTAMNFILGAKNGEIDW